MSKLRAFWWKYFIIWHFCSLKVSIVDPLFYRNSNQVDYDSYEVPLECCEKLFYVTSNFFRFLLTLLCIKIILIKQGFKKLAFLRRPFLAIKLTFKIGSGWCLTFTKSEHTKLFLKKQGKGKSNLRKNACEKICLLKTRLLLWWEIINSKKKHGSLWFNEPDNYFEVFGYMALK